MRLQRYLAACGRGSRRSCETLIAAGRVALDGRVVRDMGVRVDPARQAVTVDGVAVRPDPLVRLLLNKPPGYLCTSRDPGGRPTFHALLPDTGVRLYSAGRLDRDSEGLLLVTNDGELVTLLTHPRHGIPKRYLVTLDAPLDAGARKRALEGVVSRGERLRLAALRGRGRSDAGFVYEATLIEGRNREVRRIMGGLDRTVRRLQRVALGPVELGDLPSGSFRPMRPDEVDALRRAAGACGAPAPPGGTG